MSTIDGSSFGMKLGLMLSVSVVAPSVTEIPPLVASMVSHSTSLPVEDPLMQAPSSGTSADRTKEVDPSVTVVARESKAQPQPNAGASSLQGGRKEVRGGSSGTPSSRLLPNISMSKEPEPLSSPPSYHNPWLDGKKAPKSFAELTQDSHV